MVTSDSNWVFWGQMNDQGGPQTYYLYNVKTGVRRRFTDALASSGDLSGAALVGDTLYVAGTAQTGKCTVTEIEQVHLMQGTSTPLVVARDCTVESSPRIPQVAKLTSSQLPLRLSGVAVARPALAGNDLLFVALPQMENFERGIPSALVQLNLDDGATQVVAESPTLIAAVAADSDVTGFVAGNILYALSRKGLFVVEYTQNPIPSVSGPLVTCVGGQGIVYNDSSGAVYQAPGNTVSVTLAGPWISWYDNSIRVAQIQPQLLQ